MSGKSVKKFTNQKGSHNNPNHRSSSRKRKFPGNRYSFENSTTETSASAKKLLKDGDDEIIIDNTCTYRIIHFLHVFTAISNLVVCKNCNSKIKFDEVCERGLGFKIAMICKCPTVSYVPSGPTIGNAFQINRRIVFVMRLLGIGFNGIKLFCGLMDIAKDFYHSTYTACFDNVLLAANAIYDQCVKKAVEEEKVMTLEKESNSNLTVSGDGTWKKRGHTSRFGVITLAGKYCNKIVDSVVKSTYCKACEVWNKKKNSDTEAYEEWLEDHTDCDVNHIGSAGKMEVESIKQMFERSVEEYGVKYAFYIGDGDSATFKGLLDLDPYDIKVQKLECYLHVKKRMGSRLRKIKKEKKGLGGRSKGTTKLTVQVINKLQKYYGLAITRHQDNTDEMYKEIWATFYHLCSTDAKPNHKYCPTGVDSWCKYNRAKAEKANMKSFKHDYLPLDPAVQDAIKPIYEDLSNKELLDRCKGGNTQNNNESYNGLLWHFAPKHLHNGAKTVQLANSLAVPIFNDGYKSILKMLRVMGMTVGPYAYAYATNRDKQRIYQANRRSTDATKEARSARRKAASAQQALFEEEEGELYGPGIAD